MDLPGFETQARRLRYQTLGYACREKHIDRLLLAHHDDDQAETVLMRLASGYKGPGLQGMQLKGDIPECWGMYGVHRSGQRDQVVERLRREEKEDPSSLKAQQLREVLAKPAIFERGGVNILRPLLGFRKERLIETCRAHALSWEEDETNEDTWRTPRNTIRMLLRSAKLPQALQKKSLLHLAKQTYLEFGNTKVTVSKTVNSCEILLFDVRCGRLIVRFPSTRPWTMNRSNAQLTAFVLQKFALAVTPQEELSLQSLEHAAVSIFPNLNDIDPTAERTLQRKNFTAGCVHFQRSHLPVVAPRSELSSAISGQKEDLDSALVWELTREPFSKAPLNLIVQPSANTESPIEDNSPSWSSWQLWDGRYWIRLLNRSCRPLIVRSFEPSDLQHLHSTLSRQRYKEFKNFLRLTVPGKVRWTLLVVAEVEDNSLPMGRLLALPTLGQAGTFDASDASGTKKVEWQVRYKCVSLGYRKSDDGYYKFNRNHSIFTSWQD